MEWHAVALAVLIISIALPQLALISAIMWTFTLTAALRMAWRAPLHNGAPLWCRPLIFLFHLTQPLVRSGHRYFYRIARQCLPVPCDLPACNPACVTKLSRDVFDIDWESDSGVGREALLAELAARAHRAGWLGDYAPEWKPLDLDLIGDRWHRISVHTATEELGGPRRFTRVRTTLRRTPLAVVTCIAGALIMIAMLAVWPLGGLYLNAALAGFFAVQLWRSDSRCRDSILRLIWASGLSSGLRPVEVASGPSALTEIKFAPLSWDVDGGSNQPTAQQNHGIKGGNVVFGDVHAEWQAQPRWDRKNIPHPGDRFWKGPTGGKQGP